MASMRFGELWRTGHLIDLRGREIGFLIGLCAALELAAGIGLSYVAGFADVQHVLGDMLVRWPWLLGLAASLIVSFAGYYLAYDGIFTLVRRLFVTPGRRHAAAVPGMALFWAADFFAAWCALAAFGLRMGVAGFIVGVATGMIFTRRAAPLAGAGILALVLPVTLWVSGAPLAIAISGIFVYRILSLWLPLPFALASLRELRRLGPPAGDTPAAGPPVAQAGHG